jgi:hypothetical protein
MTVRRNKLGIQRCFRAFLEYHRAISIKKKKYVYSEIKSLFWTPTYQSGHPMQLGYHSVFVVPTISHNLSIFYKYNT